MILRILISSLLGTFLLAAQETSEMSPFKDLRVPRNEEPETKDLETSPNMDPITGERIITLDPMTIRAGRSYKEIFEEEIRRKRDDFRTHEAWAKQYRELSIDKFLSPSFLPRLGPSRGQIMKMYVKDYEFEKHLRIFELSTKLDSKESMQMRYELMNMKRNAIDLGFGDSRR